MNAPRVRGICPGLSVPMPTGDGLLVRLRPTAPVPLDAMVGFCEAARRYGNGTIEVSARGSLQVRGLTPRSAPLFASAVADLGIAAHEGVPVIAGFALISQVYAADVAGELRRAIANARLALSPKISIVVDGGGSLHLDALSADIRLRAAAPAQGHGFYLPRFHLGLGGDGASATWLGSVAPEDVVGAVLGILTIIGAHGPTDRAAAVLRAEGVEAFRSVSAALIESSPEPPQRMPAEMIGVHSAHEGAVAVGIGLAFGHTHADALAELVRLAAGHGARAVWPTHDRALLLIGVSAADVLSLTAAAEQLGFVVHAGDPRRRVAACPGAPACASGLIPARALASALTPILEPAFRPVRNGIAVHISGCPKGCAHPMPAALTVVGTTSGCGIVHRGSARAAPGHYFDPANLGDEISRLATQSKEGAHG
jgi:precorrin-3B synthase